jgi:Flp pilus assembly protein TadG
MNWFLRKARSLILQEEGGAIIEFITLGLPIFLPLFIFLTNISHTSSNQRIVQNLARQTARAFVTAPDESTAFARVAMIKSVFNEKYFQNSDSEFRSANILVSCSNSPCLTLDSQVSVTASIFSKLTGKYFDSTATEIVDKWRNSN